MRTAVFSSKSYDEDFFTRANADHGHEFTFLAARLDETTVDLAKDHQAVCVFVNDVVNRGVLDRLSFLGVKTLALFHHDPMHSDDVVTGMEVLAKELIAERGVSLRCFAAREGQTVEV